MKLRAVPVFLFVALALAGCADEPAPEPEPEVQEAKGPGISDEITIEDAAKAPNWSVGDWFGHHIYFGMDDTEGSHINTVVTDAAGGVYTMQPDDPEVAKWEATWDFPMLGQISQNNLGTTAFGHAWEIYKFPMRDGDAWTASVDPLFNGARDLAMTATFNDAISTPYGSFPGFDIEGLNSNGTVELSTDFVPEIGWYSRLTYFDTSTEATDDFVFNIRSMGRGANWNGTVHTATAESLVFGVSAFIAPDPAQGSVLAEHATLTISAESHELYGAFFALAAGGRTAIDLVDPAQKHHSYEVTHAGNPTEGAEAIFEFIELDSVAGNWELFRSHPAFVGVTFMALWEVTYGSFEFTSG